MNEKICALISFIINVISGILLVVWRENRSKTAIINAKDKIIHGIWDILKDTFCFKKEIHEKVEEPKEPEKEISFIEKGKMLVSNFEKNVDSLIKFIEDNKNSEDTKIKEEVKEAKEILNYIKNEGQKVINKINIK